MGLNPFATVSTFRDPMNWVNKKVLVTGAGGFIGSHLVERLIELGAGVRALVRYNSRNDWGLLELLPPSVKEHLEVVAGDITDPFGVARVVAGCEVIFHLAALIAIPYSYIAPSQFVAVNCGGTLNLLEAARQQDVERFVHTSTSETYGTAQYTPIDENHPLKGQSPYAASKIGADKLAESYFLSFGVPVATIRPFNTYGPRQSARAVIPTIISQALSGEVIRLGSLTPVRDLNYVSDIVEGFIKVAESPKAVGKVINIGSGKSVSIGELAKKIVDLLGGDKRLVTEDKRVRPENSEVMELLCDNRQARELLGWEPQVSLEEGLVRTLRFIEKNLFHYWDELQDLEGIDLPFLGPSAGSAHHLFPVLLKDAKARGDFMAHLARDGIQTSIHYPPIPRFSIYQSLWPPGHDHRLPRTDALAHRLVTLPLFPGLTLEQLEMLTESINRFFRLSP
jgi:NAD dependent epimerase/dehydratase